MKSKAKWYLLPGLALLLVSLFMGCAKPVSTPAPTLTAEQVISRIQVYALPALTEHGVYGDKNPVGQWAAVYEGGGQWRVRGAVVVQRDVPRYDTENPFDTRKIEEYYSTTWLYREDGQIELVEFSGKSPHQDGGQAD